MTTLFAHFTSKDNSIYFPGAPFALGALLMVSAGIMAYRVLNKEKDNVDYKIEIST
jgi:DHA1 family tetracycline resistance protein-like MFS transporter